MERAVTPTPFDAKADALQRARAKFEKGELDETIADLRSLIEEHDEFADAHALLGTALAKQGDRLGACEEYGRYLELAPRGTLAEQIRHASAGCAQ